MLETLNSRLNSKRNCNYSFNKLIWTTYYSNYSLLLQALGIFTWNYAMILLFNSQPACDISVNGIKSLGWPDHQLIFHAMKKIQILISEIENIITTEATTLETTMETTEVTTEATTESTTIFTTEETTLRQTTEEQTTERVTTTQVTRETVTDTTSSSSATLVSCLRTSYTRMSPNRYSLYCTFFLPVSIHCNKLSISLLIFPENYYMLTGTFHLE